MNLNSSSYGRVDLDGGFDELNLSETMKSIVMKIDSELALNKDQISQFSYKRIDYINQRSIECAMNIYQECFSWIFEKSKDKIEDLLKKYNSGNNMYVSILDDSFYKFFKKGKNYQKLFYFLYYVSFFYMYKFFIWKDSMINGFNQEDGNDMLSDEQKVLNENIDRIILFQQTNDNDEKGVQEDEKIFSKKLLINLSQALIHSAHDGEIALIIDIFKNAESIRLKSPESAVMKLMRDKKYWDKISQHGILEDAVGILFSVNSIEQLRDYANVFIAILSERKSIDFSDKGVLKVEHDNKHTLSGILPFANLSLCSNSGVAVGEVLFRMNDKSEFKAIFSNMLNNQILKVAELKSKNKPKILSLRCSNWKQFCEYCLKTYRINHEVYKTIQNISTILGLLNYRGTNIFKSTQSKEKKIGSYLDEKIDEIVEYIYCCIENIWKENKASIVGDLSMKYKEIDDSWLIKSEISFGLKQVIYEMFRNSFRGAKEYKRVVGDIALLLLSNLQD